MEFGYAVCRVPSPKHLPVWWHPGSSFALADQAAILAVWKEHRFSTLIYLKDDFTWYPPEFLEMLRSMYVRDDAYSELTVFHRR